MIFDSRKESSFRLPVQTVVHTVEKHLALHYSTGENTVYPHLKIFLQNVGK